MDTHTHTLANRSTMLLETGHTFRKMGLHGFMWQAALFRNAGLGVGAAVDQRWLFVLASKCCR